MRFCLLLVAFLAVLSLGSGCVKPPITADNSVLSDIQGWKTFTSEKMGIRFDYPNTWGVEEAGPGQYGDYSVVLSLSGANVMSWGKRIIIEYWPDTSVFLQFTGDEKIFSKFEDYINDRDISHVIDIAPGSVALIGGSPAYEFPTYAMGPQYALITEHSGVYEIIFDGEDKQGLSSIDQQILSSIVFTK